MGALALALCASAGTSRWPAAWAFLAVFGLGCLAITVDLARRDPALLERRLKAGPKAETRPVQKALLWAAEAAFLGLFVLAGLDRRFGWTALPRPVPALGDALALAGLTLVGWTFRANTFTAATVALHEGQALASTGPYARVRHPMYLGGLLLLLGAALGLGSLAALVPVVPLAALIVLRLRDEEAMLLGGLPGYAAYRARVRWRLLPGLW